MFKRTEISELMNQDGQLRFREKLEIVLHKLQMLKDNISELRCECEELKKLCSEDQEKKLLCGECGNIIEQGQEVAVRDSYGIERSHYHKECLRALWL